MFRRFFQRKPEALLRKLVAYNADLIARAQDPAIHTHPLHERGAKLRLLRPMATPGSGESWLGGSPRLPSHCEWPRANGVPLHFLGQIDCAALPSEIWGGLGPRAGHLAFFCGMTDRLSATVVHMNEAGLERQAPASWPDAFLGYDGRQHGSRALYDRMPCWALEITPTTPDDEDRKRSLLNNDQRSPKVDLRRPEFQPHDWRTLILLLRSAADFAHHIAEINRKSLRSVEARQALPLADLALRERIVAEANEMRSRIAALAAERPYAPDQWRPFADQTSNWRKLLAADELRVGKNLYGAYMPLRQNAQELLEVSRDRLPSHPEAEARLKSVRERVSKKGFADPELRALMEQIGSSDLCWQILAERFPDYWHRAADEYGEIFGALSDAEAVLRPVESRNYPSGKPRPPWGSLSQFQNSFPTSWEEAASFAERYLANAEKEAQRVRGHASREAEQRERLSKFETELQSRAAALSGALSSAEAKADGRFDISKRADELTLAEEDDRWTSGYEALRYRFAAFAYARDPAGLPDPIRAHFEARWSHDRDYEVAGMGGLPVGWSYDMLDRINDRVMQLELPSSHMIGWQWGDVSRLIISLDARDLRKGRWDQARAEVTN